MIGWSLVTVFFVLAELYFFLMQRSALEVCRSAGVPADLRFAMLPGTYRAARLFSFGKWVPLLLLAWQGSWLAALGIWLAGFLASMVAPVPHGFFFPMFYTALERDALRVEADLRAALLGALESIDREHRITGRFRGSA